MTDVHQDDLCCFFAYLSGRWRYRFRAVTLPDGVLRVEYDLTWEVAP